MGTARVQAEVTFEYTANGKQSYIVDANGNKARMIYDGGALVAEYDASGNIRQRYVHGNGVDQPMIWYEGGAAEPLCQLAGFDYCDH